MACLLLHRRKIRIACIKINGKRAINYTFCLHFINIDDELRIALTRKIGVFQMSSAKQTAGTIALLLTTSGCAGGIGLPISGLDCPTVEQTAMSREERAAIPKGCVVPYNDNDRSFAAHGGFGGGGGGRDGTSGSTGFGGGSGGGGAIGDAGNGGDGGSDGDGGPGGDSGGDGGSDGDGGSGGDGTSSRGDRDRGHGNDRDSNGNKSDDPDNPAAGHGDDTGDDGNSGRGDN